MTEALAGAQVLVNLSASPYRRGYGARRERMLVQRAVDYQAAVVFVNTVGGQDELVFDGHSVAVSPEGAVLARGAQFEESLAVCSIDPREVVAARLRDTRHRAQRAPPAPRRGAGRARDHGQPRPEPHGRPRRQRPGRRARGRRAGHAARAPRRRRSTPRCARGCATTSRRTASRRWCWRCPAASTPRWWRSSRWTPSAPERVTCVSMPSPYSSEGTRADARAIAENLGTAFLELSIEEAMESYSAAARGPVRGHRAGHRRGEPPGAHPRQRGDGALQQVRLARAHHGQQVRALGGLRHALRRHGRRVRRASRTCTRGSSTGSCAGATRPRIASWCRPRCSSARRRPSCGTSSSTRTRFRPTTCWTRSSRATWRRTSTRPSWWRGACRSRTWSA